MVYNLFKSALFIFTPWKIRTKPRLYYADNQFSLSDESNSITTYVYM